MYKKVLIERITDEPYAEDHDVLHPLEGFNTFKDVEYYLNTLKEQFPGFDDYEFEYQRKSHGYGAVSEWYNLVGVQY